MGLLMTEIRRKGAHLVEGLAMAIVYWLGWVNPWFFALLFAITVIAVLAYRTTMHRKRPLCAGLFALLERPKLLKKKCAGKSAVQYHLAIALAALIFPKDAALAAIVILAVGDSLALWYGVFLGKVPCPWNRKKDLDARVIAALVCSFLLLPVITWWAAFVASFAAMLAESFNLRIGSLDIDDNFVIPLVAGVIITLL